MGETVSYPEIRKIFKQELEKLELPTPEKAVDLTPKLKALETVLRSEIQTAFANIRIPEQVKPDLDSVVAQVNTALDNAVNTLLLAVDNKEVTPETDLTPVMEAIQALPVEELSTTLQQAQDMTSTLQQMVESNAELSELRSAAEQFVGKFSQKKLPEKPKEQPMDMTKMRVQRLLGNRQMA
jgi:antitoxin component of RelBE/YafQ-DinJ toxin-antitoxin module